MSANIPTKGEPAASWTGRPGTPAGKGEVWHTQLAHEVARRLETDATRGLTGAEVARRIGQYGPNALAETQGRSPLPIFVGQFKSRIVALLIAATAVALALGETIEAIAILIVLVLNAAIGFLTEWKAEQALTALRKQTSAVAYVIRDGEAHQVPAADLVPGDVALLAAGARVPADGRIIEGARLQVEEAALTGESQPVSKTTDPYRPARRRRLGDRRRLLPGPGRRRGTGQARAAARRFERHGG